MSQSQLNLIRSKKSNSRCESLGGSRRVSIIFHVRWVSKYRCSRFCHYPWTQNISVIRRRYLWMNSLNQLLSGPVGTGLQCVWCHRLRQSSEWPETSLTKNKSLAAIILRWKIDQLSPTQVKNYRISKKNILTDFLTANFPKRNIRVPCHLVFRWRNSVTRPQFFSLAIIIFPNAAIVFGENCLSAVCSVCAIHSRMPARRLPLTVVGGAPLLSLTLITEMLQGVYEKSPSFENLMANAVFRTAMPTDRIHGVESVRKTWIEHIDASLVGIYLIYTYTSLSVVANKR